MYLVLNQLVIKINKMNKLSLGILTILILVSCHQPNSDKGIENKEGTIESYKSPESFFEFDNPKILVLGCFHFEYPGMDVHKTNQDDKIDVLSEARQLEMQELIDYIKKFKPNKIAIEAFGRDPEFFAFYRSLNAYKKALRSDNSTLVISPNSEFFRYLNSNTNTAN